MKKSTHSNPWTRMLEDKCDELERENAKLLDENVKANGLLDMNMKREARLRHALDTIVSEGTGYAVVVARNALQEANPQP